MKHRKGEIEAFKRLPFDKLVGRVPSRLLDTLRIKERELAHLSENYAKQLRDIITSVKDLTPRKLAQAGPLFAHHVKTDVTSATGTLDPIAQLLDEMDGPGGCRSPER